MHRYEHNEEEFLFCFYVLKFRLMTILVPLNLWLFLFSFIFASILVCLHRIKMQEFAAEGTKWFNPKSHWYLVNLAKCTKHKSWVLISAPLPIQLYFFFTRVSGWIWIKYQSLRWFCLFFSPVLLYTCAHLLFFFFLMLLHTSIFSFERKFAFIWKAWAA